MILTKQNAPHYSWGEGCEGWRLCDRPDLSVIKERMPAGTSEIMHYHSKIRQVFYVLLGKARFRVGNDDLKLQAGESIRVDPGKTHCISNPGPGELEFLVISSSNPRSDRTDLPG